MTEKEVRSGLPAVRGVVGALSKIAGAIFPPAAGLGGGVCDLLKSMEELTLAEEDLPMVRELGYARVKQCQEFIATAQPFQDCSSLIPGLTGLDDALKELSTAPGTIKQIRALIEEIDGHVAMISTTLGARVKVALLRSLGQPALLPPQLSGAAPAAAAAADAADSDPRLELLFSGRASVATGGVAEQFGVDVEADLGDEIAHLVGNPIKVPRVSAKFQDDASVKGKLTQTGVRFSRPRQPPPP